MTPSFPRYSLPRLTPLSLPRERAGVRGFGTRVRRRRLRVGQASQEPRLGDPVEDVPPLGAGGEGGDAPLLELAEGVVGRAGDEEAEKLAEAGVVAHDHQAVLGAEE